MYLSEREMTMEAMIIDLLDSLGVFWFILLLAGLWIFFHFGTDNNGINTGSGRG